MLFHELIVLVDSQCNSSLLKELDMHIGTDYYPKLKRFILQSEMYTHDNITMYHWRNISNTDSQLIVYIEMWAEHLSKEYQNGHRIVGITKDNWELVNVSGDMQVSAMPGTHIHKNSIFVTNRSDKIVPQSPYSTLLWKVPTWLMYDRKNESYIDIAAGTTYVDSMLEFCWSWLRMNTSMHTDIPKNSFRQFIKQYAYIHHFGEGIHLSTHWDRMVYYLSKNDNIRDMRKLLKVKIDRNIYISDAVCIKNINRHGVLSELELVLDKLINHANNLNKKKNIYYFIALLDKLNEGSVLYPLHSDEHDFELSSKYKRHSVEYMRTIDEFLTKSYGE